jgi:Tfp pilus assembly protein PilE
MVDKSGFLLIELMISLALTFFLIFIVTHYTIEIKKTQQEALVRIRLLSQVRNTIEKYRAFKKIKEPSRIFYQERFALKIINKQCVTRNEYEHDKKESIFLMKHMIAETKDNNRKSTFLYFYEPSLH